MGQKGGTPGRERIYANGSGTLAFGSLGAVE